VLVVLAAGASQAHAEEVPLTTQAVADNGAFLAYAPPPRALAGLCLVDTGVNVNPDTESTVIDRTAIDGGSGNDVSPTTHGTVLAMMAAAPANGWGMVGTAPRSIQIVSVGILEPGQSTFPFSSYATGISTCLELRKQYDIKVINLSLGSPETPSSQNYETLGAAIQEAIDYGISVVAAAGNDDGGPVEYPAAYPGVLSVGATDTQSGAFCAFSNRGPGLRMVAPGCDLDGANPETGVEENNYWQGTSGASDIDAAALAALESYKPELSAPQAEDYLSEADQGTLDIAQAFDDAGLGQVVTAGEAAEPHLATEPGLGVSPQAPRTSDITSPVAPPQDMPPSSSSTMLLAAFKRPRAHLQQTKGKTILLLAGRPSETRTEVRCLGRRHGARGLHLLRVLTGSLSALRVPSSVVEISVRYTDPYDTQRDSPWTTLPVPPPETRSHGR
jgi:hypothetical protein